MMSKSSALIFFMVLLICIAGKPSSVEARGPFECPRMIDCSKVCQGYPNCCINEKAPYVATADKKKEEYEKAIRAYNISLAEGKAASEEEGSDKFRSKVNDKGDDDVILLQFHMEWLSGQLVQTIFRLLKISCHKLVRSGVL
ncbi:unnamed protein product [Vicia faba]|uniref:Uncharacterized protein n=1 Tax=Vicia faba TaxID=3906 RepID=A0AAV0YUM9_VICFA|nr:unnamed protein product [Vicia faba]